MVDLLVNSVKLPELKRAWGIRIPNPDWPHCPYCKLIGRLAPNTGWSEVTRKSGWGLVLILSLMGRSLRQSVPDHEAGSKMLMVSNLAFLFVVRYTLAEVAVRSFWKYKVSFQFQFQFSLRVWLSLSTWLSI